MSESMSRPWIRDYLVDVAETYGAQLYNAPVISTGKKKVQLTDFLTYQENSYVWAWISDKDYIISVRISKDAVDEYKRRHGRNIIDCRFFPVFIASYRPMFSPRPLGPSGPGNTRVSHISLEISYVSFMGTGTHLFGNPRNLEADEKIKTWVLGLREDGGGGNVLKSRKQEELAQNKKVPPSAPSSPPLSLYAPVSQCQTAKAVEEPAQPKHERSQDFKRIYAKRWRRIEVDPWKFATKPAAKEQPNQSNHSLVDSHLDTASWVESHDRGPSVPSSPRTPPPTSSQRQGTPTDWSPSNRGSPVAAIEASTNALGVEIQQHDEPPASHEILVPNPGSSQSYSQSQQSQQYQSQPLSQPPVFPSSCLENEFKPDASTPSEGKRDNSARCTPKMSAEPLPTHGDIEQEKVTPAHIPKHDSAAWKEPSFIAKHKRKGKEEEKGKAVQELDTSSAEVGKKRRRSAQPESPVPKRAKVSPSTVQTTAEMLHHTQHYDTEASATGKHSNDRPSTSIMDTTETAIPPLASQLSKPRLANFVVDFDEKIDLGKSVPTPRLDLIKDIKGTLLRTGRIRTFGEGVEKDGSVYIHL